MQPVFMFSDNPEDEVKAGGVLFYHIDDSYNLRFLMIRKNNVYEDFGGKTSAEDKNFYDTIAREVDEESNGIFKKEDVLHKIKDCTQVYIKNSKYVLCLLQLKDMINSASFGDKEIYEDIPRTVEWVDSSNFKKQYFIRNKLNFRLRSKHVLSEIINIDKSVIDKLNAEFEKDFLNISEKLTIV